MQESGFEGAPIRQVRLRFSQPFTAQQNKRYCVSIEVAIQLIRVESTLDRNDFIDKVWNGREGR